MGRACSDLDVAKGVFRRHMGGYEYFKFKIRSVSEFAREALFKCLSDIKYVPVEAKGYLDIARLAVPKNRSTIECITEGIELF